MTHVAILLCCIPLALLSGFLSGITFEKRRSSPLTPPEQSEQEKSEAAAKKHWDAWAAASGDRQNAAKRWPDATGSSVVDFPGEAYAVRRADLR